jgi:hypothetical protein
MKVPICGNYGHDHPQGVPANPPVSTISTKRHARTLLPRRPGQPSQPYQTTFSMRREAGLTWRPGPRFRERPGNPRLMIDSPGARTNCHLAKLRTEDEPVLSAVPKCSVVPRPFREIELALPMAGFEACNPRRCPQKKPASRS